MRMIRISEPIWEEISRWGKPGETPDVVLRRLLDIEDKGKKERQPRTAYNIRRISAKVFADDHLFVGFRNGPSEIFLLPGRDDRDAIKKARDRAISFAEEYGASSKQVNAIEKALIDAGYHLRESHVCICP